MTNKTIRMAMMTAGINQTRLAEILGVTDVEVSYMMKRELAQKEQRDIAARIKAATEGGAI